MIYLLGIPSFSYNPDVSDNSVLTCVTMDTGNKTTKKPNPVENANPLSMATFL